VACAGLYHQWWYNLRVLDVKYVPVAIYSIIKVLDVLIQFNGMNTNQI